MGRRGWGTNLDIGRTSVTGSGQWEWLPPILVAPRVVKPLRLVGGRGLYIRRVRLSQVGGGGTDFR